MAGLALAVDILAKDRASGTLRKIGDESQRTHSKLATIGAGLAGGAIGAGVVEFGKKAVEAAVEGESAQARLAQAVKNTGGSMEDVEPKVAALSQQFAKLGFTNDEVETALGTMTTATGSAEKALSLMGDAADLARYKHIGLADAGTLLARAQAGNSRALKELGITLEKGVAPAQALQNAMGELHKRIGGQATAQAGTYAGKMQALHAQFSNLSEQVGVKLLPALVKMTDSFETTASFIERNRKVIEPLVVVLGAFAGAVLTVNAVTRAFTATQTAAAAVRALFVTETVAQTAATEAATVAQEGLDVAMTANPIGIVIVAVAALAAGLVYAWKHSETFRNIVKGAFSAISSAATGMWNAIRPVLKFIVDAYLGMVGALVDGAAKAFGWVPGIGGKLKAAAKHFDEFKSAVNNSLDGITPTKTITITALTQAQRGAVSASIVAQQANQGAAQRQHRGITHVTTNVHLDGKQIASVVTKHQTAATQNGRLAPGIS